MLAKKVLLGINEQIECLIFSLFPDGVAIDSPNNLEAIGFCEQRVSNNTECNKDPRSISAGLELHTKVQRPS